MYKNTTFVISHYQLAPPNRLKLIDRVVTPLFQLSILDFSHLHNEEQIRQIFRIKKLFDASPQPKPFQRILILHANMYSNARRNKLINSKRNSLLEYFNTQTPSKFAYNIILNKANYFVPQEQLISQFRTVIQKNYKNYTKKFDRKLKRLDSNNNLKNILYEFKLDKWLLFLRQRFQNRSLKSLRITQLQQSYLQLQMMNIYKAKYSKNPKQLYQDIRDFNKMINKFNFIRFFHATCPQDEVKAQKNCERLIKMIKWRTEQTEDYLLLLIRNNSWQRFCLYVNNFVFSYQTQILKHKSV